MEYRKIPGTDLKLSVIAFGSWASGGWAPSERNAAVEAIRASYQLGVTTFDTAPIYGLGETETIIGETLKFFPRDKVQILTKFGLRWIYAKGQHFRTVIDHHGRKTDIYRYAAKASILEECENSLRRLQTDYIDLYQLHWPDPTTPMDETFEAVLQLARQGKIRYAGVSNLTPEQIAEADKTIPIVSLQMPYNMLDRKIEKDTVQYCIDHHKAILAYRPLEAGLLSGKIDPDTEFSVNDTRNGNPKFTPENIKKTNLFLERLKPLADAKKVTLAQLALRWTADRPGITCVLAGAMNGAQAIENAKAAAIRLSSKDMNLINSALLHLQP